MLYDPRYETRIKARRVLNDAADYMEAHGWCQYALEYQGRVCVMGAVRLFCSINDDLNEELAARLRKATGGPSVAMWNDETGRTKAQAVALLRKAAAL